MAVSRLARTSDDARDRHGRLQGGVLEAQQLVELRDPYLNPPEWVEWADEPEPGPKQPAPQDEDGARGLKSGTLTNLYNARPPVAGGRSRRGRSGLRLPGDISDDDVVAGRVLQRALALRTEQPPKTDQPTLDVAAE